ncbi:MAG TPA: P83/100 family protein, partial [Magnetospirillaceae bacterium]|nr:P83/100 family protein [Magnetospirillaceae bacterium]
MRRTLTLLAVLAAAASLCAQTVAEDELKTVAGRVIEFINYVGPHERIDTLEEIRELGTELGRAVRAGALRAGAVARYSVIRVRAPSVSPGFDADIIILGPGAGVDHIRNLRQILGAYLEEAYGYSRADGFLLATYLTVYNAVYRGDLGYFGKVFKPEVLVHLTAQNAGLSVRYDEWPGRSRIVLPITARAGEAGRVDTAPITVEPVVRALMAETGTPALQERRDMVELEERELAERRDRLEADRAEVAAREEALAAERAQAEAARAELEEARDPGPGQEAVLTRREAEVAAVERAVAEQAAEVEAAREAVVREEAAVAAREAEITQDRAAVAADQRVEIARQVAAAGAEPRGTVLLDLVDPGQPYARLALVDLAGGRYLRIGDINTIRADSLLDLGGTFAAVAGREGGAGAVRLVLLDPATLSTRVTGTVDVHPGTGIWREGAGDLAGILAVIRGGAGGWVLGLFDPATLELRARSTAEVSPY